MLVWSSLALSVEWARDPMSRAAWAAMGQESSLADLFGGAGVQNHAGETVSVLTGLKDKTVLLFFGGKWAEPCEAFRQLLTHIYDVRSWNSLNTSRTRKYFIISNFLQRDRSLSDM